MKTFFVILVGAIAIAGGSDRGQTQAPRATASSIAGIVVSAEDGRQPIRRAMVTIEGPSQVSQITDDDGRFAFDGVLAGEYDVTATRAAYLPAAYGARRPGRLASRLSVASGAVINDVTLYMARGAAIEGTVRDVNGEPAANVGVVVSLVGQIDMMSSVLGSPWITDDRGMYRAYGLAPGAYTVMATPQSVRRGEIVQPTSAAMDAAFRALTDASSPASSAWAAIPPFDRTVSYGPVFHPNSPTPAQAGVITVAAGDERPGVDINLMLVPTRAIDGIVLEPSGQPASQIQLFISGNGAPNPFSFDAAPILTGRSTVLGAGRFRYTNVTPGRYTVTAKRPADSLWAKSEVDVTGSDVTGLELRLRPALSISGRVIFDGKTIPPPAEWSSVRITLSSPGGSGGGMGNQTNYGLGTSIAVTVDDDGMFRSSGIIPGAYVANAFIAGNAPATGWWLRSAMINGTDAVDVPATIEGANASTIVFTFSDRHAELSGTLSSPAGQPTTDFDVVVIPAGRALWQPNSRRMKIARPSTAGRFVFADLPPGDYLIAAVTDFAATDFNDRAILEQLAVAALKVSVTDGAKVVQDLRIGGLRPGGSCDAGSCHHPPMRSRLLIAFVLAVVFAGTVAGLQQPQSEPRRPRVVTGRSKVATKFGIVAASQPLAARAGVQVLEHGGNAIDAAIAANAVEALVEPYYNGIGGDLFAIYYEAKTGKLYGLNAGGWAPTGLTPELLRSKGNTRMPSSGIYSVTVPGVVKGWEMMRARFGKLPMADILAPAIFYAEDGFPVSDVIANAWNGATKKLQTGPHAAEVFLPGGRAPRAGELFRNPALAGTMRLIAEKGPAGFYEGKTAAAILAVEKELGGTMTAADLKDYQPEWVDPISTTYRGWQVYELPPNTQGIAALMMLNMMEQYPLGEYGLTSPKAMHVMIETKKLAYADMIRYVADPKVSKVPTAAMLSKDQAKQRAALIDPAKAACTVEPSKFGGLTDGNGGDTIYLSVIDRDGNIVSLIQSLYSSFGSGVVAPGTGVMLHNRGALFTLEDGHPNQIAPRKRPLHTIIPAFMSKDDVRIGFGIMGGFNQAQAHAQFVSHIVDFGLDVQEALEVGRFNKESFTGCDVSVEALVPEATRSALAALGHQVRTVQPRSSTFGYGQAVMSNGAGVHFAGSEPRHDGAAIPEGPPVFKKGG